MKYSVVIASGKGGVGKSTLAARLGLLYATSGLKTLLIDCDAGLSSLDVMLRCGEQTAFSWYDAYTGRCTPEEAVVHCEAGPDLLPAPSQHLPEEAPDAVKAVLDPIKDNYDIVLVDAPAGISQGLRRAANAVKKAIILATADEVSVKDAAVLEKVVKECGIEQTRLVINRYNVKAAKKGKLLTVDEIIDRTSVQLLGIIPEDSEIMYSTVTGKINVRSKSFRAISRISERIKGENIPLSLSLLK